MNRSDLSPEKNPPDRKRPPWSVVVLIALASAVIGALAIRRDSGASATDANTTNDPTGVRLTSMSGEQADPLPTASLDPSTDQLILPQSRWQASGIQLQPARRSSFSTTVRLTGKVSLNQDRIAHIYPMVDGTVERVSVGLGEVVKADQLLATIHSREIGEAKLTLVQARLQLELARSRHALQTEVASNVSDLTKSLRNQMPIEEIELAFRNRPMGEHREHLLAAYSKYLKSAADVSRLQGISQSGAVSGKQLLAAEANRNADLATYQSRLEETEHGLKTSTLLSSQKLKEAQTQVAVAETSLRILGCRDEELEQIDLEDQGEAISHYSIRAPFDGTVLTKDVVLSEQVRPDVMLLSIADLSTVWITADLYQEHIPLLESLTEQTIQLHSDVWPDQVFEAKVFFAGETMDESTRTISMRAITDNPNHQLKPGMFVTVNLPGVARPDVLQVPLSAVQEHAGETFVFVHRDADRFERRVVQLGPSNEASVVVAAGLQPEESVVVDGGFILKSQMLADLMGEE